MPNETTVIPGINQPSHRTCKACGVLKEISEYYFAKSSGRHNYECKNCENKRRVLLSSKNYVPRPKNFKRLPKELRDEILTDVEANFLTMRQITTKYADRHPKVSYANMNRWKRLGYMVRSDD